KTASPVEYEVSVEPDLSKFSFTGTESVKVQVLQPTREIVMNALNLKISSAELAPVSDAGTTGAGQSVEIKLEPESEKVRFIGKDTLAAGTYVLKCSFEGTLNS